MDNGGINMNLVKEQWQLGDKEEFLSYLDSFRQKDKEAWSRRILNSKLDVLAIPTKTIYGIVKEICKGNYKSFLDLKIFSNYESIAIYGMITSKITDFSEMLPYLTIYLDVMENWAHCDLLSLPISAGNKKDFLLLSDKYLVDPRIFVRRLSIMFLFQMAKTDESILPKVFNHLSMLKDEEEYYVIMMAGWLLSECIILYKNKTLQFIKEADLNPKILNKGIQKCRESRRLSQEEKDNLLSYKI